MAGLWVSARVAHRLLASRVRANSHHRSHGAVCDEASTLTGSDPEVLLVLFIGETIRDGSQPNWGRAADERRASDRYSARWQSRLALTMQRDRKARKFLIHSQRTVVTSSLSGYRIPNAS
jgi:hypothetical protein